MEHVIDVSNTSCINYKSHEEKVQLIIRQTTYTYNEAKSKLSEHNNNYIAVINEYIKPDKILKNKSNMISKKSSNQKIYAEIRKFLDNTYW
jgi:hypothetical protein